MPPHEPIQLTDEERAALDSLPETEEPKRRGRKPGSKAKGDSITKQALADLFEMASASAGLASVGFYPPARFLTLDKEEIDALTEAWYPVLTMYPGLTKQLARGNKLTMFGRALFTTAVIGERKYKAYAAAHQTGATRADRGYERNGQDYASPSPHGFSPVPDYTGQQT